MRICPEGLQLVQQIDVYACNQQFKSIERLIGGHLVEMDYIGSYWVQNGNDSH